MDFPFFGALQRALRRKTRGRRKRGAHLAVAATPTSAATVRAAAPEPVEYMEATTWSPASVRPAARKAIAPLRVVEYVEVARDPDILPVGYDPAHPGTVEIDLLALPSPPTDSGTNTDETGPDVTTSTPGIRLRRPRRASAGAPNLQPASPFAPRPAVNAPIPLGARVPAPKPPSALVTAIPASIAPVWPEARRQASPLIVSVMPEATAVGGAPATPELSLESIARERYAAQSRALERVAAEKLAHEQWLLEQRVRRELDRQRRQLGAALEQYLEETVMQPRSNAG